MASDSRRSGLQIVQNRITKPYAKPGPRIPRNRSAEVASGVPEAPADVASDAPEAPADVASDALHPSAEVVFSPKSGMVEGLSVAIEKVLKKTQKQFGGWTTITNTEKPEPSLKNLKHLESNLSRKGDQVSKVSNIGAEVDETGLTPDVERAMYDENIPFADEVRETFFGSLPDFATAWNVRLAMECIASTGTESGRAGPGSPPGFAFPETFKSIECYPGTTENTHVVRISLDSGQEYLFIHGPDTGRWTMDSAKDEEGGGMAGGAPLSSISVLIRKGIAKVGLLVESYTHTAFHMARERAEKTISELLPPVFKTDEYSEARAQCVGIVEAMLITTVISTKMFSWGEVSVPYRAHDFEMSDVQKRYDAFLNFDVESFMKTSSEGHIVSPLYSMLIVSAIKVSAYLRVDHNPNLFATPEFMIPSEEVGTGEVLKRTFRLNDIANIPDVIIEVFEYRRQNNITVRILKSRYDILGEVLSLRTFVIASNSLFQSFNRGSVANVVDERTLIDAFTRSKQALGEAIKENVNILPPSMEDPVRALFWFAHIYANILSRPYSRRAKLYPYETFKGLLLLHDLSSKNLTYFPALSKNTEFNKRFPELLQEAYTGHSVFLFILLMTPDLICDTIESMTVTEREGLKTKITSPNFLTIIISVCMSFEAFPTVNGEPPQVSQVISYLTDVQIAISAVTVSTIIDEVHNQIVVEQLSNRLGKIEEGSTDCISIGNVAMMLLRHTRTPGDVAALLPYIEQIFATVFVKLGPRREFLLETTNYGLVEKVHLTEFMNTSIGIFLIERWGISGPDGELHRTGEFLPTEWVSIGTCPQNVILFVSSLSPYVDNSTPIQLRKKAVCNMATEMYEYDRETREIYSRIKPYSDAGRSDVSVRMSKLSEALPAETLETENYPDPCEIGVDRCLEGYNFRTGNASESGNTEESETRDEHLYFSVAQIKEYEAEVTHAPLCYCAAHILVQISRGPVKIPESLYSVVGVTKAVYETNDIAGYVTSKGTARYVKDHWNKNELSEALAGDVVRGDGGPSTSSRPDLSTIISSADPSGDEYAGYLNEERQGQLDIIPGSVNLGGSAPLSTGGGGTSGLSALTFAFLGAVTVAASLCRRP